MPETNLQVTAGSGASIDVEQLGNGNLRQVICIGDPSSNTSVALVDPVKGVSVFAISQQSDQCQSVTGASGAAVTVTLPASSGQFHYIAAIEITKFAVATLTASATPTVVTTTNLPGSLAWTFDTAGAIGTTVQRFNTYEQPLKSSVVNTATTIVCPATTSVIWRVNVHYYLST